MENSRKLIAEFEIPEYLREIQVSNKQRPKYYYWDGVTIKAKGKKLLQRYINQDYKNIIISNDGKVKPSHLKFPYFIVGFKDTKKVNIFANRVEGKMVPSKLLQDLKNIKLTPKQKEKPIKYFLYNIETKERVIANNTQVGKPNKIIIKGQDMYSGVLNEFTRAKIVNELKKDYTEKISWYKLEEVLFILNTINSNCYPVYIELEIIDTIRNCYDKAKSGDGIRWDVGNRAMPYMKTFVDFLVESSILPDDDRLHVAGESYYFTPCEKHEDRKLIFRIYSNGN